MRRSLVPVLCAVLAVPLSSRAQLSVQLKMERDTLILFESIPVVVNVHNFSGHRIELTNQGQSSWLNFAITDEAGASLSPVGEPLLPESATIPPGRTVEITVNLLPHYDVRQRGTFTARALVDVEGTRVISPPIKFTITNGREVWRQTIGLPVASGNTNEEYRTYSLLLRRSDYNEVLYVSVQDEPHGRVYGVLPLGEFIALGEPSARADASGHLHVLYRSGPRSISYDEIAPDAKTVKRMVYSDVLSTPQLVEENDGTVIVRGGEQVYPHVERVMTDDELKPHPLSPPKTRKKKWWWPFGPRTSPPEATNQVSSATSTNAPSANFSSPR
jgi:hypothetical protein